MNNISKILFAAALIFCVQGSTFANTQTAEDTNTMTRTEICKKNYSELFGGEALVKTGTDAEFMAILQKSIFGEVFTIGNLDKKTREMLTVVSLATQQALPQLKAHTNAALNVGVSPIELREAIYQCAPFIGFPKTLNAISVMNDAFKERGIQLPLEDTTTTTEESRFSDGFAIQNPIYGDEIKEALSGLPEDMGADVARMLTEVCFGDFYTRKGLDVKTRELLIVGLLVTTGNTQTLKSHIRGNIKAGNSPETIAAAIIQVMPYTGFPNAIAALKILKEEGAN